MTHRATPRSEAVEYPTRDGKPMAESDQHGNEIRTFALDVLRAHFVSDPNVYVASNNLVYYERGVREPCVSPDVYVVHGVAMHERDSYVVWNEGGRSPCFVLEVTSKSTRREDTGRKLAKYRDRLRVPDYFLFDPRGDWIPERLRGLVLEAGEYLPIAANAAGRLPSRELGLELGVRDGHLRFFLPDAPEPLPTGAERIESALAGESREREARDREREARDREREAKELALAGEAREREAKERALAREAEAQEEAERLRAELERLRRARP